MEGEVLTECIRNERVRLDCDDDSLCGLQTCQDRVISYGCPRIEHSPIESDLQKCVLDHRFVIDLCLGCR